MDAHPEEETVPIVPEFWFERNWKRRQDAKVGDTSNSAFVFDLFKGALAVGLDELETVTVIRMWWKKHEIQGYLKQLLGGILPAARREVEPCLEKWRKAQDEKKARRTKSRLEALIQELGYTPGPKEVSERLGIGPSAANMQLKRLRDATQSAAQSSAATSEEHFYDLFAPAPAPEPANSARREIPEVEAIIALLDGE